MTKTKKLPPIPPGDILRDALDDAGLSANRAALMMRIPNNRLNAILQGKRAITTETAMRLAQLFGTSAKLWLNLQMKFDLETAQDHDAERIALEVQPLKAMHHGAHD